MPTQASQINPLKHSQSQSLRSQKDEVLMLDLLIVLAERRKTILAVTVASAILTIFTSFFLPKRYTATVTLMPPQQNSSMASALASQLGNLSGMAAIAGGGLGPKNPNDMYVGMLKSRAVEDSVIQHFGLMQEYQTHYLSDARKQLEKYASVEDNNKDGLLHISVEDRDPRRAADLANGYVAEFHHLTEHLAITEAAQRRIFFEQQLGEAENQLKNAEETLKRTEQQTGLIALDSQARALIESVASLRAQIAAKEVQIQAIQTFATDQNSQVVQAQQELQSLKSQLAKLGGEDAGSDESLLVPKGRVPEASIEFVRRLRDVRYNETVFEILARQFEIAKLDEAKEGSVIQVVDPAVVPDKPSFPRKTMIVLGATEVGFIIGLFVALIQAGFSRLEANPETSAKISLLRHALSSRRQQASGASSRNLLKNASSL